MSQQSQWLFEMPAGQMRHTPQRNRGSVRRPPHSVKRTANSPQRQRRPAMQQQHPGARSSQAPQGAGAGTGRILIATIDRFEFGSYLLKKRQFEQLADLIFLLNINQKHLNQISLSIEGHTDNVGGDSSSNRLLSGRRAMEVESYLRKEFSWTHPNFITVWGRMGASQPVASNKTKDGQACNRRVEVFSNIPLPIPAKGRDFKQVCAGSRG
jgi:OmpA-OmpF porin, OOP family